MYFLKLELHHISKVQTVRAVVEHNSISFSFDSQLLYNSSCLLQLQVQTFTCLAVPHHSLAWLMSISRLWSFHRCGTTKLSVLDMKPRQLDLGLPRLVCSIYLNFQPAAKQGSLLSVESLVCVQAIGTVYKNSSIFPFNVKL